MAYSIPIPPEHEISESRVEFSTRGRVLVLRPGVESFDPGSSLSFDPGSSLSTRGRVFRPGVESFDPGVESESFDPGSSLSTRGRECFDPGSSVSTPG